MNLLYDVQVFELHSLMDTNYLKKVVINSGFLFKDINYWNINHIDYI